MLSYTKDEVIFAAKQFCFGVEAWASCFVGFAHDWQEIERDENHVFLFDVNTDQRLSASPFVCNVTNIYDFAQTGVWEGKYIFEDSAYLENSLNEPLTELSAFCEVFDHEYVNFHDYSGEDLLEIYVNDEKILSILSEVIQMAFARYSLITGGILELDHLAKLANVSLKTVRNAVSSKSANRIELSANTIAGRPCVDADEAMRWLEGKKAYTGPFIMDEVPTYKAYYSLGQLQYHCLSLMKSVSIDWDELQKRSSWDKKVVKAFQNLTKLKVNEDLSYITPENLNTFGKICKVDNLEIFVKEGSKIAAATLAEFEASKLFS